jgi:hypothetical protein
MIDAKQFYLTSEHKAPRQTKDFYAWQKDQGRKPHDPVPIKYDRPRPDFSPEDPVWYSVRELTEYVRAMPGWCGPGHMSDHDYMEQSWCWGFNTNDALALYDKGWEEGLSVVKHGMDQAATAAMMRAMIETVPVRDMHGSFIDMDAYLKGQPDCMFEFAEEVRPNLHLEVEIDEFIVCSTEADEILYRGVAIMSAIMALRRLGVFVTAYTKEHSYTDTSTRRRKSVTATVHVMNQDVTENLTETLLFLSHPGYHRKVYFHAIAAAWGCTYTGLANNRRDTDDFIPKPGSGKIVIPGHFEYTDDSGIDWGNSWASPKAAEGLVAMMLKVATP